MDKPNSEPPVAWAVSLAATPIPYDTAVGAMEQRAQEISEGLAAECVWLLEHPSIYTAGTSAKSQHLLTPDRFPVFQTGRGGQYTYHGPGQQIIYVMLDVKRRFGDVRAFVTALELWMLEVLRTFDIQAVTHKERVGIWVPLWDDGSHRHPARLRGSASSGDKAAGPGLPVTEAKIGAIGIRLKRWISLHGISLNMTPDLSHFDGIVPCGISDLGATSLQDLGRDHDPQRVQMALRTAFEDRFGPTVDGPEPVVTGVTGG